MDAKLMKMTNRHCLLCNWLYHMYHLQIKKDWRTGEKSKGKSYCRK